MKNFLIFLSVVILAVLAIYDTQSIIEEISAVTPAQVEMKEVLPNSKGEGIDKKFNITNTAPKNTTIEDGGTPRNFKTPQNTTKEISPRLNPIEKQNN